MNAVACAGTDDATIASSAGAAVVRGPQHAFIGDNPRVARTRPRVNDGALQSPFATEARAGAKSSTTVTIAVPELPRRGSSMRSIASPLTVRAVIPWRLTAP